MIVMAENMQGKAVATRLSNFLSPNSKMPHYMNENSRFLQSALTDVL